jgi:hypothetical protein
MSLDGLHLLDQRRQHTLNFIHLAIQQIELYGRQKIKIARQQQVIFEFGQPNRELYADSALTHHLTGVLFPLLCSPQLTTLPDASAM